MLNEPNHRISLVRNHFKAGTKIFFLSSMDRFSNRPDIWQHGYSILTLFPLVPSQHALIETSKLVFVRFSATTFSHEFAVCKSKSIHLFVQWNCKY